MFALLDELLGNFKTQPAAKRVSGNEIGATCLETSHFGDAMGSHRGNRPGNRFRSIQWHRLQAINRTITLKVANQMAVTHHEASSVVHKEKWQTYPRSAKPY